MGEESKELTFYSQKNIHFFKLGLYTTPWKTGRQKANQIAEKSPLICFSGKKIPPHYLDFIEGAANVKNILKKAK